MTATLTTAPPASPETHAGSDAAEVTAPETPETLAVTRSRDAELYLCSAIADTNRATATALLTHPDPRGNDGAEALALRHTALRARVGASLTGSDLADLLELVPALQDGAARNADVLDAAATLATYLDVLICREAIVLQREVGRFNVAATRRQLDKARTLDVPLPTTPTHETHTATGQYL